MGKKCANIPNKAKFFNIPCRQNQQMDFILISNFNKFSYIYNFFVVKFACKINKIKISIYQKSASNFTAKAKKMYHHINVENLITKK